MFKPYNVAKLKDDWELNKRWQGITRPYSAEDVVWLRGCSTRSAWPTSSPIS